MHLPRLQPVREVRTTQDLFFGLNHNLRLRGGELYDMENLTSDLAPVLSPRKPRGIVARDQKLYAMTGRNSLILVEGTGITVNGIHYDLGLQPGQEEKQVVNMGAYLVIFPDKVYFNTADPKDFGSLEASTLTAGPVNLIQCSLDGKPLEITYVTGTMPETPADQDWWLDTAEKKLKQYAGATGIWVVLESPLVKLSCGGIGRQFRTYDGVELSGLPVTELWDLNGSAMLYGQGEDYLIFPGLLEKPTTLETPVTAQRLVPLMDYVVESGNRLWGCRYGTDRKGQVVNELYCSKLGDFKNWSCYLGISTDSYRVSLGSDGPFTGAAVQGGHPLFFKESTLHKVFGQFPSNFQVQTAACPGVEPGSHRSLALVGDVLYNKSPDGICAYDGSSPVPCSQALGQENYHKAAAGALGSKYFVSMEGKDGWGLFVYDTDKNLWHREDDLQARAFCSCGGELYCWDGDQRLLAMLGSSGEPEESVPWMAESGIIGISQPGNRTLTKLQLRLQLEPGSRAEAQVEYDSCGLWESLGTVEGMSLRSFLLPILPRPCDHFRLRLRGLGRAKLFSVTRVLQPGGEIRW